jgi:DNA-binding NarL/FixJ family response regulator
MAKPQSSSRTITGCLSPASNVYCPDCDIVATIYDGLPLLDHIRRLRPDVVVQDLLIPPLNGIDIIRDIHDLDPQIRIVS